MLENPLVLPELLLPPLVLRVTVLALLEASRPAS